MQQNPTRAGAEHVFDVVQTALQTRSTSRCEVRVHAAFDELCSGAIDMAARHAL
jgi:hypothetical protein